MKPLHTHNWQTLDTAPRDGTHILFFYGSCNSVFTAWFEGTTWWLMSPTDFECPAYFEEENPANCYWQPMMEPPV